VVLPCRNVDYNFVLSHQESFLTLNFIKMKFVKPLMMLIIASAIFVSCKKDNPAPPPPVDLGGTTWSGPSTVNGINYTMSFTLASNGTLSGGFNSTTYPFAGSWNKAAAGNLVYIFFVQAGNNWKGQGTLNTETNKVEGGTLNQLSGGSLNGTFNVTKQ
jgi:hypothetical protein